MATPFRGDEQITDEQREAEARQLAQSYLEMSKMAAWQDFAQKIEQWADEANTALLSYKDGDPKVICNLFAKYQQRIDLAVGCNSIMQSQLDIHEEFLKQAEPSGEETNNG